MFCTVNLQLIKTSYFVKNFYPNIVFMWGKYFIEHTYLKKIKEK